MRPVILYLGVETTLKNQGPADIDFVVVRENTEGLYTGGGGSILKLGYMKLGRTKVERRQLRHELKNKVIFRR